MFGFGNFKTLAAAAVLVMTAGVAQAATVTYQTVEVVPQVRLVIDDTAAGPGKFRFTLTTVAGGGADFLGLGFDFAGSSLTLAALSVVSFTSTSVTPNTLALALFGNNTNSQINCGNGCNFNGMGSSPDPYDYIIRIGENGGGKNNVSSIVFDVTTAGSLANNPFSLFGVRAQGTGPNGDSSIKFGLVLVPPSPPPLPVPLPAGLPLLLAGLGALALVSRRKIA